MMLHAHLKIIHISNSAVLTKTHTSNTSVPVFVFLEMLKKDLVNLKK